MSPESSARATLRAATDGHHQRVDAAFSQVSFDDRASYGRFLRAQAAAHIPTEDALTLNGIERVVPDWPARRRSELLRADLADLGLDAPEAVGALDLDGEAASLGALYVLEGSRLGGTLLKRSVPADFPSRFLGGVDSAAWRSLLGLLDERLDTEPKISIAINAARDVFMLFEAGALRHLRAA